jgi:hypothetical protein
MVASCFGDMVFLVSGLQVTGATQLLQQIARLGQSPGATIACRGTVAVVARRAASSVASLC